MYLSYPKIEVGYTVFSETYHYLKKKNHKWSKSSDFIIFVLTELSWNGRIITCNMLHNKLY